VSRILVLMRHAKSDWTGSEPDRLRPLAARGRRQAPEAGRWLAEHVPDLDLALVSPATRTRQTWELAAAELTDPPEVAYVDELYAADLDELVSVIEGIEVDRAVVVTHNPGIEELVEHLTGRALEMKTSALAVLDRDTGELLAHGRPPAWR
jgi:phosphohistidine phosphatase